MARVPSATGSGDSSATTELGERDEVIITVAERARSSSFSTILSDDDDAPAKPRYQPGDVIIEHDDLVDADVPPPSLESKVGINVADIDELVGDSAYRGMLVDENTGQRIAPRFAWIILGLQFFFALMIYLFAYNHFNILQNVAPVPYCVDNAPGYLSRAASRPPPRHRRDAKGRRRPRREPIAPGQEADRYPKCKEFNRNVNHLPNMFHGGGRRLGGVQTTMVYGLLLLVLIPWLNADIQIGVSLIQLYRFGDASYTLQSALFGVGLLLLVLWIVYTNIRIATWTLNIRGTYLEATLNILLAITRGFGPYVFSGSGAPISASGNAGASWGAIRISAATTTTDPRELS